MLIRLMVKPAIQAPRCARDSVTGVRTDTGGQAEERELGGV